MINRALIRIKVVQLVYSYYQNEERDLAKAEKEFLFSLDKAYELYNYLLLLMVELTETQRKRLQINRAKFLASQEDLSPNMKFVDNMLVAHLKQDPAFREFLSQNKMSWNEDFIKALLDELLASEVYKEYMSSSESSFEADRDFWKSSFRNLVFGNEKLIDHLEECSLYWNDDLDIVQTFVLKTIKQFNVELEDAQIQPKYRTDEDGQYAIDLFRNAIVHGQEYRDMIDANIRNWDLDRVAMMDRIIMQIAIAELINCPQIPTIVTLNEYIDLAKSYSTKKSGHFVNGILDKIVKELQQEGVILKK
ncbi:MAG: transcription antitermination factor NusB [Bacteroidales bacterium]